MTGDELLKAIGWTKADLRHSQDLRELARRGLTREAIEAKIDSDHKRDHAFFRKFLRDRQR
jgi:hypothetical protein